MIKLKQLLKESVNGEELVASGMRKVFANAHETGAKTISYKQVESVGLGYIKDVSTAQKVAYQCAVQIADKFGYWDDEANEQFSKNDGTVAEVGLNQSPKFGEEKDAVLDYLRMIANMPEDDVPPIHVWKEIVDSANIALQHHIRGRGWSGLNESKLGTDYIRILFSIIDHFPKTSEFTKDTWPYIRGVAKNAEDQYEQMNLAGLNEGEK